MSGKNRAASLATVNRRIRETRKACQSDLLEEHVMRLNRTMRQSRCDRLHLIVAPRHSDSNSAAHFSIAWLHVGLGNIVTSSIQLASFETSDLRLYENLYAELRRNRAGT